MHTFAVEAVLAVLLVIVLMNLFKKKPEPVRTPGPDLSNLKPTDARTGDVISVAGAGDNMADLDFTADRTTTFEAGSRNWTELSGTYRERRVALRVAMEDELEVALHNDPRQLTIEDLGVSEDDLAQMDERQNTGDSFDFDNKTWLYRLSREAKATRDDQRQPTGFYYWEFRENGGKGLLTVRKPEGEPFGVTLYNGVAAGDVTVYRR
ncbi:MAG TPA: hypothetical protein VME43_16470 [Bryobacteraceae bacterium]|nr:hypothetical protein [Bryobacteraceae bacterium]